MSHLEKEMEIKGGERESKKKTDKKKKEEGEEKDEMREERLGTTGVTV